MRMAAGMETARRFMRFGVLGLGFALLLAAFALVPPASVVRAGTDTVTNCNSSGSGSLPVVFAAALSGDTITFAQDCTSTTNTVITLTSTLTVSNNLTIDATVGAHSVTISGGGTTQLFVVSSGKTLNLTGLTLTGGTTTSNGGAILAHGNSILNLTGCTFSGNSATTAYGYGGAIGSAGTVTITNSTFSGNTASNSGGAIDFIVGTLTITGSTFSGNSATSTVAGGPGNGGAINNGGSGGRLSLTLSVVAGNTAAGNGPDIAGALNTDGGGNVIGKTDGITGFTPTSSDRTGTVASPLSPVLGALASNGGTVQTFALLPGSPAIDLLACPGHAHHRRTRREQAARDAVRCGGIRGPRLHDRHVHGRLTTGESEHGLCQWRGPHGDGHERRPGGGGANHLHDYPQ